MEAYGLDEEPSSAGSRFAAKVRQQWQIIMDKSAPLVSLRWLIWAGLLVTFALRIWYVKGFYIVAYALGIFNLNLLLGFLSPQIDPELEGPVLPSKNEEFRPFVRRLPEFKFWYSSCKAFCIGFAATFFAVFDVPVFWPILLLYWFVLFFLTMKRQIRHMIKYKYVPFSLGKKTYAGSSGSLGSRSLGKDQNGKN